MLKQLPVVAGAGGPNVGGMVHVYFVCRTCFAGRVSEPQSRKIKTEEFGFSNRRNTILRVQVSEKMSVAKVFNILHSIFERRTLHQT